MAATHSTWTARTTTPETGTREFQIAATAVGPVAHVAVIADGHVVATFDAAVTVYRDRFSGRISKVIVTGAGQSEQYRTVKGALEAWAGAAAFAFMNQYQR